ncbi:MAG TPA: class I SAM-dependent methyltransferase [Proteobacteria bacterium]|nr:class I SAM-dependent methyltransferase [Pseudomonadota bacterium]
MKMAENLYSLFDTTTETHWWFVGRRKIVLSLARQIIGGITQPVIVDVGCGAGATLKELEKLGSVTGVDISPRAVGYCRTRGCRRVCLVEEESLPLGDNKISLIVSLDVLEHLDHDYLHLREYHRILKDDGKILLTVPALPWLWSSHDVANHHRRRYTRTHLRKLLEREGWKIEKLSYFCTILFPLIMVIRLISKGVNKTIKSYNADWNFKIPGFGINWLFAKIFASEAFWFSRGGFPIGSSLLAVCRKSGDQGIRLSGDQVIRVSGDQGIRGSGDQGIRRSGWPSLAT